MANVPAGAAASISSATLPFPALDVVTELASDDGLTRKRLIRLDDGKLIETVLMLYDPRSDSRGRATVCVSSQAGCAMGCVFCATGQAGFDRNLTTGEIVAQIIGFAREPADAGAQRLTNVVFMGMGEPMANYRAVWQAVETLTIPRASNMAARHITISTVGHIPGIRKLADETLQVGPRRIAARAGRGAARAADPDGAPLSAARHHRRVPRLHRQDAPPRDVRVLPDGRRERLAGTGDARWPTLLRGMNCHVNLIPVNPTAGQQHPPSGAHAHARIPARTRGPRRPLHRARREGRRDQRRLRPASRRQGCRIHHRSRATASRFCGGRVNPRTSSSLVQR